MVSRILASFVWILLVATGVAVLAQQPQIPTLQVCNQTEAEGSATVKIVKRADASHHGSFKIDIKVKCDPAQSPYPTGDLQITTLSMSDSMISGSITGTSYEQVTSSGKHTPMVYINGRCTANQISGCRFWLMIADNKPATGPGTPDIVSFLVFDGTGKRVAHGTGPVTDGNMFVKATPN